MKRIVLLVSLMLTAFLSPGHASERGGGRGGAAAGRGARQVAALLLVPVRVDPQFKMCAGVYVVATIKADVTFTPIEGGAYATIHTPRVVDPYMLVTLKKSCDDTRR